MSAATPASRPPRASPPPARFSGRRHKAAPSVARVSRPVMPDGYRRRPRLLFPDMGQETHATPICDSTYTQSGGVSDPALHRSPINALGGQRVPPRDPDPASDLLVHDRVGERADLFDHDAHGVAGLHIH